MSVVDYKYYKFKSKEVEGKALGETNIINIDYSWCAHKHSIVREKDAKADGGYTKLTCGGNLSNCMLSPQEFIDE